MANANPFMLYFGPWDRAGHFFFTEEGRCAWEDERVSPWTAGDIDGGLQPGCVKGDPYRHRTEVEGEALLHHKDGWTAISFWDRSVDTRGACNSTFIAKGVFTFDEMVSLAKARFATRWGRMKFEVYQSSESK